MAQQPGNPSELTETLAGTLAEADVSTHNVPQKRNFFALLRDVGRNVGDWVAVQFEEATRRAQETAQNAAQTPVHIAKNTTRFAKDAAGFAQRAAQNIADTVGSPLGQVERELQRIADGVQGTAEKLVKNAVNTKAGQAVTSAAKNINATANGSGNPARDQLYDSLAFNETFKPGVNFKRLVQGKPQNVAANALLGSEQVLEACAACKKATDAYRADPNNDELKKQALAAREAAKGPIAEAIAAAGGRVPDTYALDRIAVKIADSEFLAQKTAERKAQQGRSSGITMRESTNGLQSAPQGVDGVAKSFADRAQNVSTQAEELAISPAGRTRAQINTADLTQKADLARNSGIVAPIQQGNGQAARKNGQQVAAAR